MTFEKKLRDLRVSKGLTKEDLAEQCEVPVKKIEQYESGRAFPSEVVLVKLAKALEVRPIDLVSDLKYTPEEINQSINNRRGLILGFIGGTFAFLIVWIVLFSLFFWNEKPEVLYVILSASIALMFLITFDVLLLTLVKNRRIKMRAGLTTNGIVILLVGLTFSINYASFQTKISYTKEKWQVVESKFKYYMAEDFLNKYSIKGMNEQQIISYLGEPDNSIGPDFDGYTQYTYECGVPIRKYTNRSVLFDITFHGDKVISYSFL